MIRIHLAKEGALVGLAQGLDVVDIQRKTRQDVGRRGQRRCV